MLIIYLAFHCNTSLYQVYLLYINSESMFFSSLTVKYVSKLADPGGRSGHGSPHPVWP